MTAGADRRARWSALHHGIDPARVPLLAGWLRCMWAIGAVLARCRVRPTAVTVVGVLLAAAAVITAGTRPLAAAACVILAGLCDGLDGAVAVVSDRATLLGARADAVADRCADVAFAVVLGRCGAPGPAVVAAAVLAVGVDLLRRLLGNRARLTVAERPTFAACAVLGCGAAAVSSAAWPLEVCVAVWIAACCWAAGQLVASRRDRDAPGTTRA